MFCSICLDIPSSYSSLTIQHVSIDYFLAGAGASGGKFKSAENNNAVVINLDRLQRVLLGLITLEQLHAMDKLDNKSFHKRNYVPAVVIEYQRCIDPRVEQQQPLATASTNSSCKRRRTNDTIFYFVSIC